MNPQNGTNINELSEIAEMKRIFSSIESVLDKSKPSCLAVTSSVKGEGKTIMVAGLSALAARQTNKKILAIDFNWHAPMLHKYFNTELIDVQRFKSEIPFDELTQKTVIDNLDILPSTAIHSKTNNGNPFEDENTIVAAMIEQARNFYDLIFIDTSKIFPTNRRMMDPVSISKITDGVVLVVLANATSRQEAKKARTTLETAGANILGVIVNQWQNPLA